MVAEGPVATGACLLMPCTFLKDGAAKTGEVVRTGGATNGRHSPRKAIYKLKACDGKSVKGLPFFRFIRIWVLFLLYWCVIRGDQPVR